MTRRLSQKTGILEMPTNGCSFVVYPVWRKGIVYVTDVMFASITTHFFKALLVVYVMASNRSTISDNDSPSSGPLADHTNSNEIKCGSSSKTTHNNKSPPEQLQPKYRMVALDLDGTLLRNNGVVSDETCEYLRYLDRRGFVVAIATGRMASTVYPTVHKLGLPHPVPVVCSNGAKGILCGVTDDGNGTLEATNADVFYTPVPHGVAQKTIEHARETLGCVSQYYVGEDVYADPVEDHHYELTKMYQELTGCKTIYVDDGFRGAMELGAPSKMLVLCPENEQDGVIDSLDRELSKPGFLIDGNKRATLVRGHLGWFVEILHPDVNKGSGVKRLCEHLGIPPENMIAFGDGDNDYEFIRLAGKGFVMKNGRDVVKAIADEVIEYTNEEDGVVKTLQRMEKDGLLAVGGDGSQQ